MKRALQILLVMAGAALPALAQFEAKRQSIGSLHKPAAPGCSPNLVITSLTNLFSTGNQSSYALSGFTIPADTTIVVFATSAPSGSAVGIANSGTPLTWWSQGAVQYNAGATRMSCWVSQSTSSFSTTLTLTVSSGTGLNAQVVGITGADDSLPFGTNAIVQLATNVVAGTANPYAALASTITNECNAVVFAVGDDISSSTDNEASHGSVELAEGSHGSNSEGLATYYITNPTTSVTGVTNTASARDWALFALEIRQGTP